MSETVFHANFAEQNNRFAADFRSVQIVGDGGTEVTLDGEVQGTFAADVYVAAALAKLVNQSPETLDTLAELARALGNDPNFATTIMEMLGKKLDAVTTAQGGDRLYCVSYEGKQSMVTLSSMLVPYSVPMRRAKGEVPVGPATADEHAVPLGQLNTILDERIGDISAALADAHAYAQALVNGGEVQ